MTRAEQNAQKGPGTQEMGLFGKKLFKTYRKHPVLRGVDVTVRPGEAVGLLGANGAGKTTCFYLIAGFLNPDAGSVHIDGKEITTRSVYKRARRGLGYLPQESSVFRGLNVENNLRAALQAQRKLSAAERTEQLESLLTDFSLSHLRYARADALSGGERRRVEIARALAVKPRYLLMDEPLAGIDPVSVSEVIGMIGHLRQRGVGLLITDHNVRETLNFVDRAYILHEGTILAEGEPERIIGDDAVREVYLGQDFRV